ncbi:MAG: hypothetical protein WAX69_22125 [Victivallales bacterium]
MLDMRGWRFDANGAGTAVNSEIVDGAVTGKRCLHISIPTGCEASSWWCQEIKTLPGASYTLSMKAKARVGHDDLDFVAATMVYFRDKDGKWLSHKDIATVGARQAKWSQSIPATNEWKSIQVSFTPPASTRVIGVRVALSGRGSVDAWYDEVALTTPPSPVADILAAAPDSLPHYDIPLGPVSASGVTLNPDWSNSDAATWSSGIRHKLCLNGLWAVQPAVIGQAPKDGDWAFIKVPGRICGWTGRFSIYGKDKTIWANFDTEKAEAFWYVRNVEIPEGFSGRLMIETPAMENFAIRVYWNGRPVGVLTDQWGGTVELSAAAIPGDKGQLSLFALRNKGDANAHLVAAGEVKRMYDPDKSMKCVGALFDFNLLAIPDKPVFGGVRITTSVRNAKLSAALDGIHDDKLLYSLAVKELDDKPVFEKKNLRVELDKKGLAHLEVDWIAPQLWNPDDPHLYTLTIAAFDMNGKVLDETLPIRFGFREVWVDGRQLMMNGQPLRLRPRLFNFSYEAFLDDASIRRGFSLLKDMGFNCAIRPPSMGAGLEVEHDGLSYYRIADELGMLVVSYSPYNMVSGGQFLAQSLAADKPLMDYIETHLVQRLWNYSCVIAYSGFGPGMSVRDQPYNANPDWWGVKPLNHDRISTLLRDGIISNEDSTRQEKSLSYVQGVKSMDASRPFLSHYDVGAGDGWGIFDYFNWTPWQEWEEWIMPWVAKGVCPIGSWEHGLPYPFSFLNHGIPDGDREPWITEYSAMRLGPEAYSRETPEYNDFIKNAWDKNKPMFVHTGAAAPIGLTAPNIDRIWAAFNARLYRTWRTFGIPMGIEPFGPANYMIQMSVLNKNNVKISASPSENLKTPGAKADTWYFNSHWPSETNPSLPTTPTGRKPEGLTSLGDTLYANNRPLLIYLAGSSERFTAKDHVFESGEKVVKQIASVWDGFSMRLLTVAVKVVLDGKNILDESVTLKLQGGDIKFEEISFRAPEVSKREDGVITIEVRNEAGTEIVATDSFAFQVYPRMPKDNSLANLKVALYDPSNESSECLSKFGFRPRRIKDIADAKESNLLVIGRRALASLRGVELDSALPPGLPVLVLEQTSEDLERIGFRAFPTRTRDTFAPFRPHPVLAGIEAPDLRDWRVEPKLLPPGTTPLRNGYNYHAGYYGTVASVVIETPTRGNFTPLLQCEFDLGMTPLLESVHGGRRWVFCQLSLVDGIGKDPVATRLAANILRYMGTTPAPLRPLMVVGDAKDLGLVKTIGAENATLCAVRDLPAGAVAFVGRTDPVITEDLRQWIRNGGTAVVLPQSKELFALLVPEVKTSESAANLIDVSLMPDSPTFNGLGQNDFHYRQAIQTIVFDGKANVAELAVGNGKLVLLGFDPRTLDLDKQPYLRLTWRHQHRVISQILANIGASLDAPMRKLVENIKKPMVSVEFFETAKARVTERADTIPADWNSPAFDDHAWTPFELTRKTTPFGAALLRIRFSVPADITGSGLAADIGTFDDFDETWLNGVKLGGITPDNANPELAWSMKRVYAIPDGVIKPGEENVLAVRTWNRNAVTKGHKAQVRGPMLIRSAGEGNPLYVGTYRHSDDPYLQYHW